MARRNNILITILAIITILFAGCGSGTDGQQSFLSIGSGSSDSSGGSGVDLSFGENSPPSEREKGAAMDFAFIFTNYQEHDITDMRVQTSGYETGYVSGLSSSYSIQKIPRYTSQNGAGVLQDPIVQNVKVDNFQEKYNFNPVFDYCYTAQSSLVQQVCVPSKENNLCDIEYDSSKSVNGPLTVTISKITNVDNIVRVYFSVKNSLSGEVVNTCFDTEDYADSYTATVKLGTSTGSCTTVSGRFEIINDKSEFSCDFSRSGDDAYPSQIDVDLEYKYQQSTKKKILVKDPDLGFS